MTERSGMTPRTHSGGKLKRKMIYVLKYTMYDDFQILGVYDDEDLVKEDEKKAIKHYTEDFPDQPSGVTYYGYKLNERFEC